MTAVVATQFMWVGALEESPDTEGQDAPVREAAKADGKWHRKDTASGKPAVRVKRWGKSPPAPR